MPATDARNEPGEPRPPASPSTSCAAARARRPRRPVRGRARPAQRRRLRPRRGAPRAARRRHRHALRRRSAARSTPRRSPRGRSRAGKTLCLPRVLGPRRMAAYRVTDPPPTSCPARGASPSRARGCPRCRRRRSTRWSCPGRRSTPTATAAATAAASTTPTCRARARARPWVALAFEAQLVRRSALRAARPAGDRHRHRAAGDPARAESQRAGELGAEPRGRSASSASSAAARARRVGVPAAREDGHVAVGGEGDVAAQRGQRLVEAGLGGDGHQARRPCAGSHSSCA